MPQSKEIVRSLILVCLASAAFGASTATAPAAVAPSMWSRGVTRICAHALLFDGSHQIGTRPGAVAVAQDIRASTERRLTRIAALRVPPTQRGPALHWVTVERRLAAVYASTYLRIFDVIAAARTPGQQTQAALLLRRLVHAPDRLRETAIRLEDRLQVPDCTGGAARPSSSPSVAMPGPTRR